MPHLRQRFVRKSRFSEKRTCFITSHPSNFTIIQAKFYDQWDHANESKCKQWFRLTGQSRNLLKSLQSCRTLNFPKLHYIWYRCPLWLNMSPRVPNWIKTKQHSSKWLCQKDTFHHHSHLLVKTIYWLDSPKPELLEPTSTWWISNAHSILISIRTGKLLVYEISLQQSNPQCTEGQSGLFQAVHSPK